MFHYLINSYISEIIVQKDLSKFVVISKKFCLNSVSKLLYDHCFQITKFDMRMQSFKRNRFFQINDFRSICLSNNTKTTIKNRINKTKIRLLNDIMIYVNKYTIFAYVELINKFFTLWKDEDFIDISKNHWM